MRMRKKKHCSERIEACGELFIKSKDEIQSYKLPVLLEIGCGKGRFITETAQKNPNFNFIALEKISDVILLAAERTKLLGIQNVKFINKDVKNLCEFFDEKSVSCIYLNFPDPWIKKGHYKRRLTYKEFLDTYKKVLIPGGAIFFKTDNRELFDFSIEQFNINGFRIEKVTNDLHNSEYEHDNIHTEYETQFSEKGFTINRLEAYLI